MAAPAAVRAKKRSVQPLNLVSQQAALRKSSSPAAISTHYHSPAASPSKGVTFVEPPASSNEKQAGLGQLAELIRRRNFEWASQCVNGLSPSLLHQALRASVVNHADLCQQVPYSLVFIETIYSRLFLLSAADFPRDSLSPRLTLAAIIKYFYCADTSKRSAAPLTANYDCQAERVLKMVAVLDPSAVRELRSQRDSLREEIEGLGSHGPVMTSDSTYLTLHEAIHAELVASIARFRQADAALHQQASSATGGGVGGGKSAANGVQRKSSTGSSRMGDEFNHQRLLDVSAEEVQQRLFNNKALLNVLEPAVGGGGGQGALAGLYGALVERVRHDKHVLVAFNRVRDHTGIPLPAPAKIGPKLLAFVGAIQRCLDVMDPAVSSATPLASDARQPPAKPYPANSTQSANGATDSQSEQTTPHHSIPDPGQATGLNSVPMSSASTTDLKSAVNGAAARESAAAAGEAALRNQVQQLRQQLARANSTIRDLQEREQQLMHRISSHVQKKVQRSGSFETLEDANRPSQLIQRYADLYCELRPDAMDALDDLITTDSDSSDDQLKQKILFSVVVLAFRSVQRTIEELRAQIMHLLAVPQPDGSASPSSTESRAEELQRTINEQLRHSAPHRDYTENYQEVCGQLWSTLFEYPGLQRCEPLLTYIRAVVELAWLLLVANPPYHIRYHATAFDPNQHNRFHSSDESQSAIRSFVWPALVEDHSGHCVSKAVVIT